MSDLRSGSNNRMGLQSRLPIQIPIIHHFDVHNNFMIMEDCGDDVITLRKLLCSGKVSSQKLAENIGAAVGQCIALVHEWRKTNPDGLLDTFGNSLHARRTTADLNYDRRVATLQHCDKDDLPLLSGLEIPPSDIQTISEIIDEYHTHLMSSRVPGQDVVVMLKIFQYRTTSPSPLQSGELARTGFPGSEIGLFCAYLELLGQGSWVAHESTLTMLRSFLDAYVCTSNRDIRLA